MSSSINIGELTAEITRKEIKNLRLSVCPPNGGVKVVAPSSLQDEAIRLYLISKLGWIKRRQRKFKEQTRQGAREYEAGESHYFFGGRYLLRVIESQKSAKIVLSKKYINLHIKHPQNKELCKKAINEWYRKELKSIAAPLIVKWEKILGVKVEAFGVKRMKTKWGSCNTHTKSVWLNLELAKKHPSTIEYVVLHEIAHLVERLHNDRFFALMDRHMPRWRERKMELEAILN